MQYIKKKFNLYIYQLTATEFCDKNCIPMKVNYEIYEIYDVASAFISDKSTKLNVDSSKSVPVVSLSKDTLTGRYTIKFQQSDKKRGQILFQANDNPPAVLAQTKCKICTKNSIFSKHYNYLINNKYFKLLKRVEQRQNNQLELQDNSIKIHNLILNYRESQR